MAFDNPARHALRNAIAALQTQRPLLGKSRLRAEMQAGLPAAARAGAVWHASGHPQGLHQPFGMLRDLLFWHHGVKDSDKQAQAHHKLAATLTPIFGAQAEEQTALLGQLVGLDCCSSPHIAGILRDGRQLRDRGLQAWAEYLRLQAARQPLVLPLEPFAALVPRARFMQVTVTQREICAAWNSAQAA